MGHRSEPTATPSTCLCNLLLKIKTNFFTAISNNDLNSDFFLDYWGLNRVDLPILHIYQITAGGISVHNDLTSKLTM